MNRYHYKRITGCEFCGKDKIAWRLYDKERPRWHMDFDTEREARTQRDFMIKPLADSK